MNHHYTNDVIHRKLPLLVLYIGVHLFGICTTPTQAVHHVWVHSRQQEQLSTKHNWNTHEKERDLACRRTASRVPLRQLKSSPTILLAVSASLCDLPEWLPWLASLKMSIQCQCSGCLERKDDQRSSPQHGAWHTENAVGRSYLQRPVYQFRN